MRALIFPLTVSLGLSACAAQTQNSGAPVEVAEPGYSFSLPAGFTEVEDGHWRRGSEGKVCNFQRLYLTPQPDTSAAGCTLIAASYGERVEAELGPVTRVKTPDGTVGCRFLAKEKTPAALAVFALPPSGLALRAEGTYAGKMLNKVLKTLKFTPVKELAAERFIAPIPEGFSPGRGLTPPEGGLVLLRTETVAPDARLGALSLTPVKAWLTPPTADTCASGAAILAKNRKLQLDGAEVRSLGERPACVIDLSSKKHDNRKARQYNLQVGEQKLTISCSYDARDAAALSGCEAAVSGLKPVQPAATPETAS